MGASKFCEQCGSALEEADKFCMTCGQPVDAPVVGTPAVPAPRPPVAPFEPAPEPRPIPISPAPEPTLAPTLARTPSAITPTTIGIVALVVIALGGGIWWFLTQKPASPPANKPVATATATGAPPSASPTATVVPVQPGEAFVGRWFPDMSSGAEPDTFITFKREGNQLIGTGKKPSDGQLEFPVGAGPKLTGVFRQGTTSFPATAELLSDNKKMVVTLAPPNSEYQTEILWRDEPPPPDKEVPGIEKITNYSEQQARDLISMREEVQKFAKQLAAKKSSVHIDVAPEDDQTYSVHVYEIVDDGDGMSHTATFAWYKVDRKTGKVSPGM